MRTCGKDHRGHGTFSRTEEIVLSGSALIRCWVIVWPRAWSRTYYSVLRSCIYQVDKSKEKRRAERWFVEEHRFAEEEKFHNLERRTHYGTTCRNSCIDGGCTLDPGQTRRTGCVWIFPVVGILCTAEFCPWCIPPPFGFTGPLSLPALTPAWKRRWTSRSGPISHW